MEMRAIRRLWRDRRGTVAVMTSLLGCLVLGCAAIAVDVSSFYFQKRKLQGATDMAVLAAAADPANAQRAATATLAQNGFAAATLQTIQTGTYTADPTVAPAQRFVPQSGSGANAVRVTSTISAPMIFGRIFATGRSLAGTTPSTTVAIGAQAVAAQSAFASFAVGSGLASLDGGILNSVLGALLGTTLSLSVMDYQALLGANLDMFAFSNALATRANLTGVTYGQLAAATVRESDVMNAVVDAAKANPAIGYQAVQALTQIAATQTASSTKLSIASFIAYGPYAQTTVGAAPMPVGVNALNVVSGLAQIANGTNQIQTALAFSIPGLASASLQVSIGQRPVGTSFVALGAKGASVTTAQTRLLLSVQLVASGQSSLVNVPVYLQLAAATAVLTSVQCTPGNVASSVVTLGVTPSVIDAWIGAVSASDLTNFSSPLNPGPATLLNLAPLASVTGLAHATMTNFSQTTVPFSYADIQAGTVKTTSTTDYLSSLLSSLTGGLQVQVNVVGLGIGLPAGLNSLVATTVVAATSPIDQVLANVLGTLGLSVGQAQTWVSGVKCGSAVLVN